MHGTGESEENDVVDLNIEELDIERLEQRLELAVTHLEDAWEECASCGSLVGCGTFHASNCPVLMNCDTYDDSGCKPQE